jgi:hypothetical protein
MNFNRRDKRSLKTSHLDVECLGERIAPAVYQSGPMHQLALSRNQLQTLVNELNQIGDNVHLNRLGIIVGNKMSLGLHLITISAPPVPVDSGLPVKIAYGAVSLNLFKVKGPVKPITVTPLPTNPPPPNIPFSAVALNSGKLPVKPITVTPVVPHQPVNIPFGAVSLNIAKPPVKPVPVTPVPHNSPVNEPFSLVTVA